MNVVALFDGISCGQIALNRLGIKYTNYFSSEIDQYAMQIAQKNYPKTIQLGDITNWPSWKLPKIDLLLAGFPCQSWSVAGNRKGDKDPRGKLVHVLLEVWEHLRQSNPNLKFLFENVKMKREFLTYINNLFGVNHVLIDSALVSAQSRNRVYWTNIPTKYTDLVGNIIVPSPVNKDIQLKDILEPHAINTYPKYFKNKNCTIRGNLKHYFKTHSQYTFKAKNGKQVTIYAKDIKTPRSFYETRTTFGKAERKRLSQIKKKDVTPRNAISKHYLIHKHEKANCLVTVDSFLNWIIDAEGYCRKLTIIEQERLQTIPDKYTQGVSNYQRTKMLGNGWNIDTICHLLTGLIKKDSN